MIKLKDLITETIEKIILVGVMRNVNGGLPNQFRVTLSHKEPIHRLVKNNNKLHLPAKPIARFKPLPHQPKWVAHNEQNEEAIIIPTLNTGGGLIYKDKKLYYEDSDGDVFIVKLDVPSTERLAKKAKHDLKDFGVNSHQFLPPPDDED